MRLSESDNAAIVMNDLLTFMARVAILDIDSAKLLALLNGAMMRSNDEDDNATDAMLNAAIAFVEFHRS